MTMRCLLAILVVLFVAFIDVTNAQIGFGAMPVGGMSGGMGMMGGGGSGPYGGMGATPYSGMSNSGGGGWGRRRMMGGMMNPYMGMMYGRR